MKKQWGAAAAIVIAAGLVLQGCSPGGGSTQTQAEDSGATVNLPAAGPQRILIEQSGALATQQYLIARLKTEALIGFDFEGGNPDDLAAQPAETLEAWSLAQMAADLTVELADTYGASAGFEDAPPATMTDSAAPSPSGFWSTPTAHADDPNAALRWAEELTARFDSYPAGKQVRTLAEQLGTDAKKAFEQLKMAQAIIAGDAYKTEGDWAAAVEKSLIATQTVCKVGLFIGSGVATGGVANGILEAGGLVISGVDTLVDIAKTSSTIILGEGDKITIAAEEMKQTLAPLVAASGATNIFSGGAITAGFRDGATLSQQMSSVTNLKFIGDGVLSLIQSGDILGARSLPAPRERRRSKPRPWSCGVRMLSRCAKRCNRRDCPSPMPARTPRRNSQPKSGPRKGPTS